MKTIWLSWVLLGLLLEVYALATGTDTLSAVWFWLREALPRTLALGLSAALGSLLVWLLSVHWVFSGLDRPGLDIAEKVLIVLGAVFGLVGGIISRRNRRGDNERT